jgi:hypothetical protein
MDNNNMLAKVEAILEKSAIAFDRHLKQQCEEDEKRREKVEKEMNEIRELIKKNKQMIGGMANSNGDHAEEYFYNSFLHGNKTLFGEEFDDVWGSTPGREKGFKDEYDIVLFNGQSVCIIEVKYKADSADFTKFRVPLSIKIIL